MTAPTTLRCAKAHTKNILNVPTGTLLNIFLHAPCICNHFLHLAMNVRELFGLILLIVHYLHSRAVGKQLGGTLGH